MKRDRVRGGVIRGREGKPKRDKKRKREKRADQTEAARDSVRTETATTGVVDRTEVGSIFPEDIARREDPDRRASGRKLAGNVEVYVGCTLQDLNRK